MSLVLCLDLAPGFLGATALASSKVCPAAFLIFLASTSSDNSFIRLVTVLVPFPTALTAFLATLTAGLASGRAAPKTPPPIPDVATSSTNSPTSPLVKSASECPTPCAVPKARPSLPPFLARAFITAAFPPVFNSCFIPSFDNPPTPVAIPVASSPTNSEPPYVTGFAS